MVEGYLARWRRQGWSRAPETANYDRPSPAPRWIRHVRGVRGKLQTGEKGTPKGEPGEDGRVRIRGKVQTGDKGTPKGEPFNRLLSLGDVYKQIYTHNKEVSRCVCVCAVFSVKVAAAHLRLPQGLCFTKNGPAPSPTVPPLSRHCPATVPPLSRHRPATVPPPSRHRPATVPPPSRHRPATVPQPRHCPAAKQVFSATGDATQCLDSSFSQEVLGR